MMETDIAIAKKIDTLVEMAESSLNIDAAKAELKEIEKQSTYLKNELTTLSEGKDEDKYFKASDKQVDENIKVSLESKIRKQEKSIKKLQKEIDEAVALEADTHNKLSQLKEENASCNEHISVLQTRLSTISDSTTEEYYNQLLKEENNKLEEFSSNLKKCEKEYDEILERLNLLNLAMEEMKDKLASEKARLAETKANLMNPASYIDEDLKQIDEERIQDIKKEMAELDKRKLEIITDPAMIAEEAKNLIALDDRTSALSKVRELVTIVRSKPFMDVPTNSDLSVMLQEEEEKAGEARDEFASFIDSKDYSSGDNKVVKERINYVNIEIASLEDKIRLAKEEIKNIDTVEIQMLNDRLKDTLATYEQLEIELANYKEVIENENEEKTPKRRAVLASAYDKKEKELKNVHQIIENYKEDQKNLINKAYLLETEKIAKYEEKISKHQQEIAEMNLLLANTNNTKDVLAIENDKKKLKELDEVVKGIKHRSKYTQTPSEIYHEIEVYLGTLDEGEQIRKNREEKPVIDFDYDIKADDSEEELPVVEEDNLDFQDMAELEIEPTSVDVEEVSRELPSLEKSELVSERIKVIHVEPLEENNDNNSFVIGAYDDDENQVGDSEV